MQPTIHLYCRHNLHTIFAKFLDICKQGIGATGKGTCPARGGSRFSALEVVALSLASEAAGIDSESLLFFFKQESAYEMPNLISRRQYNDRRKFTARLCERIRARIADEMDGGEEYFCIDSKPIEICRWRAPGVAGWGVTGRGRPPHTAIAHRKVPTTTGTSRTPSAD